MSQDKLHEALAEAFPAGKAAEIRPTVIWAIKQWRHKFTPEELADAILLAPPVAAALAQPAPSAEGRDAGLEETIEAIWIEAALTNDPEHTGRGSRVPIRADLIRQMHAFAAAPKPEPDGWVCVGPGPEGVPHWRSAGFDEDESKERFGLGPESIRLGWRCRPVIVLRGEG